jgi:hypothetical protein
MKLIIFQEQITHFPERNPRSKTTSQGAPVRITRSPPTEEVARAEERKRTALIHSVSVVAPKICSIAEFKNEPGFLWPIVCHHLLQWFAVAWLAVTWFLHLLSDILGMSSKLGWHL